MELDDRQRDNRANWDDRVGVHVGSETYDIRAYVDDPHHVSDVVAFDAPLVGDLTGRSVVHLQCHIGTDTVSLARLGAAEVVGLDFSEPAIEAARSLATRSGTRATFVLANVYDAPAALGRTFDLVYTSVGAVNWIADLDRWAAAVAGLLEPGGRLYLREGHPALWTYAEIDGEVVPHYDYWTSPDRPLSLDADGTYTDGDAARITHTRIHEWNHSLPDMLNALVGTGMVVDRMAEHEGIEWPFVPSAVKEGTQWFPPGNLRGRVPAMYSLWATRR